MEARNSIITPGVKGMALFRFHRILWGLPILCGLVAGCDPVRTTSQPVRLKVVDLTSGRPVVGAQVTLAFDLATARPLSKEPGMPPQEWKRRVEAHKRRASRSVADEQGQADLDVKVTSLDRTWGAKPPPEKDFVTGYPYLISVKAGEAPEEEMSLVMKPGAMVKGKHFAVTVLAIPEPQYVKTNGN